MLLSNRIDGERHFKQQRVNAVLQVSFSLFKKSLTALALVAIVYKVKVDWHKDRPAPSTLYRASVRGIVVVIFSRILLRRRDMDVLFLKPRMGGTGPAKYEEQTSQKENSFFVLNVVVSRPKPWLVQKPDPIFVLSGLGAVIANVLRPSMHTSLRREACKSRTIF